MKFRISEADYRKGAVAKLPEVTREGNHDIIDVPDLESLVAISAQVHCGVIVDAADEDSPSRLTIYNGYME